MAELLRDYFRYYSSFNDVNIASLRKNTAPVIPPKFYDATVGEQENNNTTLRNPIPYLKEGGDQPNQNYKCYAPQRGEQEEVLKKIKKPSFGTGVLNVVENELLSQSHDYKNKDFEAFSAHRFFTNQFNATHTHSETDNKSIVFAPKQLKNKMIDT